MTVDNRIPNFWWCPTHHLYRGGDERPCADAVRLVPTPPAPRTDRSLRDLIYDAMGRLGDWEEGVIQPNNMDLDNYSHWRGVAADVAREVLAAGLKLDFNSSEEDLTDARREIAEVRRYLIDNWYRVAPVDGTLMLLIGAVKQIQRERDERQARINRALVLLQDAPGMELTRVGIDAVRAALVGDQPPTPADKTWCPRCQKDATEDRYTQESASLWRCLDCHAVLQVPDPPLSGVALPAVEEADDAAEPACECFVVPEEQWTRHYDATEPGSMVEQNPDCRVHPAQQTDAAGDLP